MKFRKQYAKKSLCITQADVAKTMGVTPQSVSNLEQERCAPSVEKFRSYLNATKHRMIIISDSDAELVNYTVFAPNGLGSLKHNETVTNLPKVKGLIYTVNTLIEETGMMSRDYYKTTNSCCLVFIYNELFKSK